MMGRRGAVFGKSLFFLILDLNTNFTQIVKILHKNGKIDSGVWSYYKHNKMLFLKENVILKEK